MRETYMHVAGVVVTDPLVRKFDDGRQVMSFRVGSTSRRYDSNTKNWVDGQTLWVKVSCWRELATNAIECVRKGDRLVVWGRVRTEQWKGEDGGQRSDLAIEAEALGHDLAFGVSRFERRHRTVSTQTLTPEGVVDTATGELSPSSAPTTDPGGTASGREEVLDELDDLGDLGDLGEEDDVADQPDPAVALLASA